MPPHDDFFESELQSGNPSLEALARARATASSLLTADPERRKVGEHYYPLLVAAFKKHDPERNVSIFERIQLAISLGSKGDVDVTFGGSTFRFDWSEALAMLLGMVRLAADVKRWIPEEPRRLHSEEIFSIATFIAGAANTENVRHPPSIDTPPEQPSAEHLSTLAKLAHDIEECVRRCEAAAERHALSSYALGMLCGVGVVAIATVIIFVALGSKPAFYGVAVPAGGLGATVSVLQRMTTGKLRVDYQTRKGLLLVYGALRPVIGAVFGALVFALFVGGFVPLVAIPTDHGTLVGFYAVFAFLGGFSERFAQDMLAGVTNVFPNPKIGGD